MAAIAATATLARAFASLSTIAALGALTLTAMLALLIQGRGVVKASSSIYATLTDLLQRYAFPPDTVLRKPIRKDIADKKTGMTALILGEESGARGRMNEPFCLE